MKKMNELENIKKLRKQINDVDFQIVNLFSRRFELVANIGKIKKEYGLSIKDIDREKRIMSKIDQQCEKKELVSFLQKIYKEILYISCEYENFKNKEELK